MKYLRRVYYSLLRFWYLFKPTAVQWKRLHEEAKTPVRGYPADGAFDIFAVEDITFQPGDHLNCSCGIGVMVQEGWSYDIRGRSSLNRIGMIAALGLCDAHYCNDIKVVLSNLSGKPYVIKKGERIGQVKLNPVWELPWEEVEEFKVKEGTRGMNGWGSTGR